MRTAKNGSSKLQGAAAAAIGVALLAGGSTYALWTDTAELGTGVIQAGSLSVDMAAAPVWRQASTGQVIDLSTYRVVPGEVLQGTFALDAALEGDTLAADLKVTPAARAVAGKTDLTGGLTMTYQLLRADGAAVPGAASKPVGQATTVVFAAQGPAAGTRPTLPARLDGTADLIVRVQVTFTDQTGTTLTGAATDLHTVGVSLTQKL